MNPRKGRREEIGLSQTDAAAMASISLATWRRWEDDPTSVSAKTRVACEKVMDQNEASFALSAELAAKFSLAWRDCYYLTPRQACALASTLNLWGDLHISGWLDNPLEQPLHSVEPFSALDIRVMMLVDENRAWAAAARDRCFAVADEIERGVLSCDRPGCFFDELLIALALPAAEEMFEDEPELFEQIPARPAHDYDADDEDDETDYPCGDTDWGMVSAHFDGECRWDEWEVPALRDHPLLRAVLTDHPPYSWFDVEDGSGSGYLQRMVGLAVDVADLNSA